MGRHAVWSPTGKCTGALTLRDIYQQYRWGGEEDWHQKVCADDTKLGHSVVTDQDARVLEALGELSQKWGMEFYVPKCKVMHLGHNNPNHQYEMAGQPLSETREEKDLGVTVADTLKPSGQCATASKTVQTVLGQISRAFHYRETHLRPPLQTIR